MIVATAKVTIKPEWREEAVQLILALVKATQAEEGCISYKFYADLQDPNTIFVFEEWETEEALAKHLESEHMKTFLPRFAELLAGEPELKRYVIE